MGPDAPGSKPHGNVTVSWQFLSVQLAVAATAATHRRAGDTGGGGGAVCCRNRQEGGPDGENAICHGGKNRGGPRRARISCDLGFHPLATRRNASNLQDHRTRHGRRARVNRQADGRGMASVRILRERASAQEQGTLCVGLCACVGLPGRVCERLSSSRGTNSCVWWALSSRVLVLAPPLNVCAHHATPLTSLAKHSPCKWSSKRGPRFGRTRQPDERTGRAGRLRFMQLLRSPTSDHNHHDRKTQEQIRSGLARPAERQAGPHAGPRPQSRARCTKHSPKSAGHRKMVCQVRNTQFTSCNIVNWRLNS